MYYFTPFTTRRRSHLSTLWLSLASMLLLSPVGLAHTFTGELSDSSLRNRLGTHIAQGPSDQNGNGSRKGRKGRKGKNLNKEERAALQKEVQRRIQTFVTVELATQLELSDEKALRLSSAVKAHLAKRQDARDKIRGERDKLEALIQKNASDRDLQNQTKKVMAASRNMHDEDGFMEATRSFLTAQEQAKLVLIYHHIQKEVRRMVRHAKQRGKGGGHRGRGHGPPPGGHGGPGGGE